ncbi:sn1-specific diacylglycerol lipase alpha isoform X2 [Zootermopsis nevadensis]|uniref:sn1-specific diacylglycerol lipase alpha isoform X2 n=1 Tax=Zootermopsis nevadensis TaxID=136037 RepID=UPI000B8E27AA|nr:sn1-specific diacylglycerol lipase alpha isoform X2 [Zootermopsis nevadensis]
MPGIVVFKRRWSVGSDDLVVPGVFLFVLHLIWIVVLCVMLGIVEFDRSVRCVSLLWEHMVGYLAILTSSLLVEFFISVVAMRGSILDTEARAPMQYLLYIRLGIMLMEIVWLVLGVTWLTYHYNDCPVEGAKEAILGIVICNWCVLLSIVITVWCTFDAAGRSWVKMKKYQRSMRESESRFQYKRSGTRHRNWRQRKVIRAYQDSWDHRCRILFCCMRNSDRNRNSFTDIARLLSDFFRDLDVVPSDVVAGLVLLRKFQKIEREAIVKQRKNDTYEYLSGVAVTSQTQFLALNDPEHFEHFQTVIHYMHFALGAYGWPMFLMTHSGTGVCQLCTRLRCCCFPCMGMNDGATVVSDNCCQCNYAALRRMVEIGEVEVIYATYHVDVGETPFFVAVDFTRHKIVISIRGTLSMKDVITDLNAEGEPLPLNPPREDWLGHKGMVQAAEYIRDKLEEEAILARAFSHNEERGTRDFELVLVGHSLGAGTASILAILLRQDYPTLQCFAYSPPGGSLSMPAVEYTKSFITSVVVGKDVVPRIGLHQLESLRADLINTIKRSKDPKWKTIVCSVICCGCASLPTSAAELKAEDSQMTEYLKAKGVAREVAVHPSDSSIALTLHQPLYPPGRIIHIVRHHPTKGEQVLNKHEPVYQAVWANNTDFDEVLISPVMIQDHMPDNVLNALNKVITTIGPAKPQRAVSSFNINSAVTSAEHLDSEHCHLLATNYTATKGTAVPGSPKAATPPHKLCLETSFTSLQSPSSDIHQNHSLNSSTCSQNVYSTLDAANGRALAKTFNNGHPNITSPFALHPVLSWEYASLLEEQLLQSFHNCSNVGSSGVNGGPYSSNSGRVTDSLKTVKVDLIHDDWFGLAPLATPESLSEVSSISSRTSSLMLNIDRTLKDMFGHHRGCMNAYVGSRLVDSGGGTSSSPLPVHAELGSSVGVSYLNSKSPKFLRTSNGISGLVNINSRVRKPLFDAASRRLTNSSSGDEDLSFESAQQHISSDDEKSTPDNCNNSNSEVFVSVKGTPFSSADSVTVSVDVHHDENPHSQVKAACSRPSQPLHCSSITFLQPASLSSVLSPADNSMVIISSSPKQVKFLSPQNSLSDESAGDASESPSCQQDAMFVVTEQAVVDDGRKVMVQNNDSTSSLEGMMVLHLGRSSNHVPSEDDYKHKPTREMLLADIRHNLAVGGSKEDRQRDKEILNKNIMYFGSSISALKPNFSSADTSPVTDDNSFCSSSTGNNNIRDFQLCVTNSENSVFKKQNGDIVSSSREEDQVLRHTKDQNTVLCSSGVETGLIASKRNLSGHETSMAHLQAMESLPLLSNIGEVHDKAVNAQKKYTYPITSLGKGESSV